MAATLEGQRLTEAFRLAQARLGAQTVQRMFSIWSLLDPSNLDLTFERWLTAALPIIEASRQTSSLLASNYYTLLRGMELGIADPFTPVLAAAASVEQVTTSLLVTGPIAIRSSLGGGVLFSQAVDLAQTKSAAAAMRHALNGGRDTVMRSMNADSRSLGWARAAAGDACGFCAMLASRGPVYSTETVGFEAHDHCSCSAEPVFRHDSEWPAGSRQYREVWDRETAGLHGNDAINAFRRAIA